MKTEEDEAFDELAKRQGYWGMQGSRKHQILRFAENVESKGTSMTTQQIDAMKMALFALDIVKIHYTQSRHINEAITAIKEALAEHAMRETRRLGQEIEQEPVAWIERDIQCDDFDPDSVTFEKPRIAASSGREWVPLYTQPPQRTWVGLTKQQQLDIFAQSVAKKRSEHEHYMAIEQALKEKNR